MTETHRAVETIDMTHGLFQLLLNATADDVEEQTSTTRALVSALHGGRLDAFTGRWAVQLTEENLYVVHSIVTMHTTDRPAARTRYTNTLCRQSRTYEAIHIERGSGKDQDGCVSASGDLGG